MKTVKLISEAVDSLRDDIVRYCQKLTQTPSLPDEEHEVQELVSHKLKSLGMEVDVFPSRFDELKSHPAFCDDGFSPNSRIDVVARWRGGDKTTGRSLILNGHVDVVGTGDESLWHDSPWSGAVRDEKLYGRGSCDMKSGLTAAIFAIQSLQQIGFRPAGDILLQSVVGEETGGVGTLATIVKGYTADAAVILEPTNLKVCPVQSGALTFRLSVPGKATHAAMKKDGVSAIEKFSLLLEAIHQLEVRRHEENGHPLYDDPSHIAPVNIGTIHGGQWHSTVPEEVVAEGRFGVFPEESVEEARASLKEAIQDVSATDQWLNDHRPKIEWFEGQYESGETPTDDPLIETLLSAHKEVTGSTPKIEGVTYGSDLRLFTNHANIPAVLYGPGDVRLAHAANEYVEVEEVIIATKVMTGMIVHWCGGNLIS